MRSMEAAAEPAESALRWNPLRGPARRRSRPSCPPGWTPRRRWRPRPTCSRRPFALEDSRAWARGLAMGQSRASQLVARIVDPRPGERVLDLCAAPGAKTTHLAALSRGGARITAVELRPARARALRELARRMGAVVEVVEGDAPRGAARGRLRRRAGRPALHRARRAVGAARTPAGAAARSRSSPLAELQRGLLGRGARARAPGRAGRLLHLHADRRGERGRRARRGRPRSTTSAPSTPGLAHPRLPGALLTLPHRHGTDGFFVARMRAGDERAACPAGRSCCRR